MTSLARRNDARMLFIDDVHAAEDVHECERDLERIMFEPDPEPTHLAVESDMLTHAYEALHVLKSKSLSKRRRAREIRKGVWRCSGFPLQAANGRPLCLFFDLGLTWYKRSLGYGQAVNVVPEFYEEEQRRLVRLVQKAMPDFELRVIVYDAQGKWHYLDATQ